MGFEPTTSSYFAHSSVELQLPYSAEPHSVGLSVEILMYTANLYCIYDPDFNRVSTFRGTLPTELHTLVCGNICFRKPFSLFKHDRHDRTRTDDHPLRKRIFFPTELHACGKNTESHQEDMTGFEPATFCFEGICSVH